MENYNMPPLPQGTTTQRIFTVRVKDGEDLLDKMNSFVGNQLEVGLDHWNVLSASGSLSKVTLKHKHQGQEVERQYEGCYDILSFVGSFDNSPGQPNHIDASGVVLSAIGPNGFEIGGTLGKPTIASEDVEMVIATPAVPDETFMEN